MIRIQIATCDNWLVSLFFYTTTSAVVNTCPNPRRARFYYYCRLEHLVETRYWSIYPPPLVSSYFYIIHRFLQAKDLFLKGGCIFKYNLYQKVPIEWLQTMPFNPNFTEENNPIICMIKLLNTFLLKNNSSV